MVDDESKKDSNLLGEALKKVFTVGATAAFLTEEGIRSYLGELKLPKDIMSLIIQSANKSKDEITNRVSKEMISLVQKIDFMKEFSRFAETHKFKISAEIEILKKNK